MKANLRLNLVTALLCLFVFGCSTPEQQSAEHEKRQSEETKKQREEQDRLIQKYAVFTTEQLRVKVVLLNDAISRGYWGTGIGLLIAKGNYDGKVKEREEIEMEIARREGTSQTGPEAGRSNLSAVEGEPTTRPEQSVDFRIRAILGGMNAQELQARAEQLVGLSAAARIGGLSLEELKAHALEGDTSAQYDLGRCYYLGQGVPKDSVEAVKWFRKAANQGNASAQCALGVCYGVGQGVLQDHIEAATWYRKAAEQGNASSQYLFGVCCYAGLGVAKSDVEAYKWFNIAATYGDGITAKYAFRARDLLAPILSRVEIVEAQREAADFVPQVDSHSGVTSPAAPKEGEQPKGSGTGFFITEDGFLITNEHVVKDATKVRLVTSAGTIDAKVVQVDAANDLTLLKANGRFSPLPIAASRSVHLGSTVATIGFPVPHLQGYSPKLAKGEIASLSGIQDDPREFQISVPVQHGNSGGALVDEHGNVVGIVAAKLSARTALAESGALPENVNYAVKSSLLLSFLESVPDISAKLKDPISAERKFDDVVQSAQQAAVLVLVY